MIDDLENLTTQATRARDSLRAIEEVICALPTTFENGTIRYDFYRSLQAAEKLVEDLHGKARHREGGSRPSAG